MEKIVQEFTLYKTGNSSAILLYRVMMHAKYNSQQMDILSFMKIKLILKFTLQMLFEESFKLMAIRIM